MSNKLAVIPLVLALLIASCAPGAAASPAPHEAGRTSESVSPALPDSALTSSRFDRAKRAFMARFKKEAIYGPAPGTAGFKYPEKEALQDLSSGLLLAGIKDGLARSTSQIEVAFWLDLFSLMPDREPGAARFLLDYLGSLGPEDARYVAYQAVQAQLGRLMSEEDAEAAIATLGRCDEGIQYLMLAVLRGRGFLTTETGVRLLSEPGVDPYAVVGRLQPITTEVLSLLGKDFTGFPMRAQIAVVTQVASIALGGADEGMRKDTLSWLRSRLDTSKEPAVRQEILYRMYQADRSQQWLTRLVSEVDRDGAAPGTNVWGNVYLMRDICAGYPGSYLARGCAAYERVRGRPYFVIDLRRPRDPSRNDLWPFQYGKGQYDPAKEIPAWLAFLEKFPKHPGADDAAYRLGRCYELRKKWKEALTWLTRAASLPDGDLRYDAVGRLVFVLDARVPAEQLERLVGEADLLPQLKPLIQYTLAVRDLRNESYQRASERLAEFIDQYGGDRSHPGYGGEDASARPAVDDLLVGGAVGLRYPFWAGAREQLGWASRLAEKRAELQPDADRPETLYRMGAEIFHNRLLYYNFLWAGSRQGFNWIGHLNELWAEVPEGEAYLKGLMNYQHALGCFEAVQNSVRATAELKAKALYSQGLSYIGILQWGVDSEKVLGAESIRRKIVETYTRFVEEYPGSTMADDALRTLYAYTHDGAYLDRLMREYPYGARAPEAR